MPRTQLANNRCYTVVTNTTHKEQVPHTHHTKQPTKKKCYTVTINTTEVEEVLHSHHKHNRLTRRSQQTQF